MGAWGFCFIWDKIYSWHNTTKMTRPTPLITKKMESHFMSTHEEIQKLRAEIAELTRLLKAQRLGDVVVKRIGAPSIADIINNKALDI
jgi:hypothetical protein